MGAFLKRQDENTCIISNLNKNVEKNRTAARECLEIIISTIKYLVRQDIALRGKDEKSGNFIELLRLRAESNDNLKSWLAKFDVEKTRQRLYLTHDIQNKIISDISREIFLQLKFKIRPSKYFGLICDGTQDVAGLEQKCVSIRYVDEDLVPHESFARLYSTTETTGQSIANMLKDVCIRFGLSVEYLRGQVYDSTSNMSGAYNGAQAILLKEQPLANYTHCISHCTNLVAACWVHQLFAWYARCSIIFE